MLIREDEIGMSLSEIYEYRDKNGIEDIDPRDVFVDDEMSVYDVGAQFTDDTFEIAFPNLYESNHKVYISYIDINKDKEVRKEMLIHPTKGKHFALVPEYVNEVTVEVIDTNTLTELFKYSYYRNE